MRRSICLFIVAVILFSGSMRVLAYSTNHIISTITVSAGGIGYSDTLILPNDSDGNPIHFDKWCIHLKSFQFELYPANVKPVSSLSFNFRLVTVQANGSHVNCASVLKLYNANSSANGWVFSGFCNSGDSVCIKANISGYSLTGCTMKLEWYLVTV